MASDRPMLARYGALYFALFAGLGITVPFLPLWLTDRGLTAAETGIVVGAPILLRVLVTPLLGEIADRLRRPVLVLKVSIVCTMLALVALAQAEGFWALLAANMVAQAFSAGTLPLYDSLVVRAVAARPAAFGPVRMWGSVAFIVGNLGAGALIANLPVSALVWAVVAAQAIAIVLAVTLLRGEVASAAVTAAVPPTRVLLVPGLVVAILAAMLIQGSHGAYYGMSAIHWTELGFDGAAIGALWAAGVGAEVVVLYFSAWFTDRFAPRWLMLAGAGTAILRWVAMSFDPSGPLLVALQLLHAMTFVLTYLGTVRAVAVVAPSGAEARGQAIAATCQGVSIAAAIALAGQIHGTLGAGMYLVMAAVAAAGLGLVLAGRRWLPSAPKLR